MQHHLNPQDSLDGYDMTQARLSSREDLDDIDTVIYNDDASRDALKAAIEIEPVDLTQEEVGYLIDFLNALTDPVSLDMRSTVPSGLPLAD